MKKTIFILTLMALAAAAWANGGADEAAGSDGPVTIEYYMWEDPTYMNIVEAYSDSRDDVTVNVNTIASGDYETKLATLLAGGVDMDAYMQKRQTDMFPHLANGYIAPLDDLIADSGFDIGAIAPYKSQISVNGKVYAIPFRGASYYTYYNRKVFEDAGVPTPDTFVEAGEWTWAKFEELANRIASGDGEIYGGIMYTWGSIQTPAAHQAGEQFITADGQVDVGPAAIEGFEMRKRLEESGAIIPLLELKVTKTHYSQAFYEGNVGMLIIGEWFPGFMIKGRDENLLKGYTWNDWGVTRLPCDEREYTSFGAGTFNHIHARSRNKEAAFDLIGWMGGPEGAAVVAANGFLTPMITPAVMDAFSTVLPDEDSVRYFTERRQVNAPFYNKYGSKADQFLGSLMEEYLVSDWSSAQLEDKLVDGLEEIIATTD